MGGAPETSTAKAFDQALARADLAPDSRDRAAALKVFLFLEDAKAALRQAEREQDEPR